MKNLRERLEYKHLVDPERTCSIEEIAKEVMHLLNAENENYIDVTGFAKDFYLNFSPANKDKELFYETLKVKGFFRQLNSNLYIDDFRINSWTIYTIGKFSNYENAGYLEVAYEKCLFHNPILSYRALSELEWLSSEKTDEYLENLKAEGSIISKLILLYYWEMRSYGDEFKSLLTDKELIEFVVPVLTLTDYEEEVSNRLLSFENHISGIYDSKSEGEIDKSKFEYLARAYFGYLSKNK